MPLEDQPNSGTGPSSSDQDQSSDPAQAQPEEGTQEMEIQTSDSDPLESSGEGEILRKRQRQQSPAPGSSTSTPHGSFAGIEASPHKNKTFEELITAAGLVSNMALAHEIVVDGNFKLSPREMPENSIEKQVHKVVHQAFWDSLGAQLSDDPASYTHAVTLVGEIKTILLSLLLPHNDKIKTQILEVMDLTLIQQQADHQALDVGKLTAFVVQVMSKLCAPVRDEEIAKLATLTEPVEIFREIFRVLDLMKLDMANFTIQSLRPHLQQKSIEYERNKFQEFLKTQQDGLQYTSEWLEQGRENLADKVKKQQALQQQQQQAQQQASSSSEGACGNGPVPSSVISPAAILNHAYVDLLNADPREAMTFPETILMDQGRFYELGSQVRKLVLVGSVLLVTYTNTGNMLAGIQGFPSQLKHNLFVLLEGASDFNAVIDNIAVQVTKEVNECLKTHGFPEFDELRMEAFKSQIRSLALKDNHIHSILDMRLRGFLVSAIAAPSKFDPSTNIPPGLTTMQSQVVETAKAFVRLVVHNRAVFGPFYAEILTKMLKPLVTD